MSSETFVRETMDWLVEEFLPGQKEARMDWLLLLAAQ